MKGHVEPGVQISDTQFMNVCGGGNGGSSGGISFRILKYCVEFESLFQ